METRRAFLATATAIGTLTAAAEQLAFASSSMRQSGSNTPLKQYRIPNTDLTVSRMSYGCAFNVDWEQGTPDEKTIEGVERPVHTAYSNGITLFDLADQYSLGKVETIFGEILKRSPGLRNRIVIQSKCGIVYKNNGVPFDLSHLDCSQDHIIASVEGSLRRLRVDHLDILLLHFPDLLVRPEEVAAAFDQLHRAGKVRYFGVSNHAATQIELLQRSVHQPLVVNQVYFGLGSSYLIAGGNAALWGGAGGLYNYSEFPYTLDYCRLRSIQVQAYSPLRGDLLNQTSSDQPEVRQARQLLADLAKEKDTNPSAIALAWIMHHPAGIVPVIGSSKAEHVTENCAAERVTLTRQEWYDLLRATIQAEHQKT